MTKGKLYTLKRLGLMFALAIAALALVAACGDDDNGNGDTDPTATGTAGNGGADPTATTGGGGAGGTIEIGYIPGWPDAVSTSNLWKVLLEERGYTVNLTSLDVAPLFAGLANGDVDVYMSAWLPNTHGVYTDQFGDQLEQINVWYEPAGLYLTVPSYVDVDSLADLQENADLFNSTITGIEPGAGMMGILRDEVMGIYGIEDWTLLESSTPAMLAELQRAIDAQQPIVVTLWSPGWWYGAMDLKNLEDPEGAWGDPDQLTITTRTGFSDDFPEVAEWWSNWSMSDEDYAPLEELVVENEGQEEQAVRGWIEENRDLVDSWFE